MSALNIYFMFFESIEGNTCFQIRSVIWYLGLITEDMRKTTKVLGTDNEKVITDVFK